MSLFFSGTLLFSKTKSPELARKCLSTRGLPSRVPELMSSVVIEFMSSVVPELGVKGLGFMEKKR